MQARAARPRRRRADLARRGARTEDRPRPAADARIDVSVARPRFNELAARARSRTGSRAYDRGEVKVTGDRAVRRAARQRDPAPPRPRLARLEQFRPHTRESRSILDCVQDRVQEAEANGKSGEDRRLQGRPDGDAKPTRRPLPPGPRDRVTALRAPERRRGRHRAVAAHPADASGAAVRAARDPPLQAGRDAQAARPRARGRRRRRRRRSRKSGALASGWRRTSSASGRRASRPRSAARGVACHRERSGGAASSRCVPS